MLFIVDSLLETVVLASKQTDKQFLYSQLLIRTLKNRLDIFNELTIYTVGLSKPQKVEN